MLIMGSVYTPKDLSKKNDQKKISNESTKDIIPETNNISKEQDKRKKISNESTKDIIPETNNISKEQDKEEN